MSTARRSFVGTPYKAAVKSGTAQVYGYETYNEHKVAAISCMCLHMPQF